MQCFLKKMVRGCVDWQVCADQLESQCEGQQREGMEAWTGHHRRRTKGMVTTEEEGASPPV